jgi:hypothetical protein
MKQLLKKIFKKKNKYGTVKANSSNAGASRKKPEITHNPMEETYQ